MSNTKTIKVETEYASMSFEMDRSCAADTMLDDINTSASYDGKTINKTITGYPEPSQTEILSGSNTKREDLRQYLTYLSFSREMLATFFRFPTQRATNVQHQYTRYLRHSKYLGNAVVPTETSTGSTSEYEIDRRTVNLGVYRLKGSVSDLVVFQGHLGGLNHQALLASALTDALLKEFTVDMWWSVRPKNVTGNNFYFDGVWAQHKDIGSSSKNLFKNLSQYYASDMVYDMRGKTLDMDVLISGAGRLKNQFASRDLQLIGGPSVITPYSQSFTPYQRILVDKGTPQREIGTHFETVHNFHAPVRVESDMFFPPVQEKIIFREIEDTQTPDNVPEIAAPTAASVIARVGDEEALWTTDDDAGHYIWGVVACNTNGRSRMTVLGAAPSNGNVGSVQIAKNGAADLQFSKAANSSAVDYLEVYRTEKLSGAASAPSSGTAFHRLFRVVVGDDVSSDENANSSIAYDGGTKAANVYVIRDRNRHMPNTGEAVLYDASASMGRRTMDKVMLQMPTLYRLPRSQAATAMYVGMIGGVAVQSGNKCIRFINVGTDETTRRV